MVSGVIDFHSIFESIQPIFLIFRRISVTRRFLVSLTSIVGKKIYYGSQSDQKLSGY